MYLGYFYTGTLKPATVSAPAPAPAPRPVASAPSASSTPFVAQVREIKTVSGPQFVPGSYLPAQPPQVIVTLPEPIEQETTPAPAQLTTGRGYGIAIAIGLTALVALLLLSKRRRS